MMSSVNEDRLQELSNDAVKTICADVDSVLISLLSQHVITLNMKIAIQSLKNPLKEAEELHTLIIRRGDDAYDKYYIALRDSGMNILAKSMEDLLKDKTLVKKLQFGSGLGAAMQVDVDSTKNDQKGGTQEKTGQVDTAPTEFPDNWPAPNYEPFELSLRKCKIDDPDTKRKLNEMSKGKAYDFPHGLVLIINNKTFGVRTDGGDMLDDRVGTDIDCELMEKTWSAMGFCVTVEEDCSAQEIRWLIERKVKAPKSKKCFVCVILSHGTMGAVYGVDGKLVKLTELIELADTVDMVGVPKVFIIQACQGNLINVGPGGDSALPAKTIFGYKDTSKGDEKMETSSTEKTANKQTYVPQQPDDAYVTLLVPSSLPENFEQNRKILMEYLKDCDVGAGCANFTRKADILVASATVPGYVSWRHKERGTWFIQAVVFVLKNWAYDEHIDDLFTLVFRLVGRQEHQMHGYKQIAEKKSTLRKKLYFFPGVEEDI